MKRGFKTWAENQALRLRGELRLPKDAPLEGRELAKHLRVPIATPDEIGVDASILDELLVRSASRWSAVTLYLRNSPFVVFNPKHSEQRQESDLMHEFAHILCKHPPQKIVAKGLFPFPIREYNPEQEEEADWLGATLKLPRELLMRALQKGFSDERLAEQFKCSVPLARMRRNRSGVQLHLKRLSAWRTANGCGR